MIRMVPLRFFAFLFALWLPVFAASCNEKPVVSPGEEPLQSQPGKGIDEPYPEPELNQPTAEPAESYPEPPQSQPVEPVQVLPPEEHEFAPVPGDEALSRGNAFIESYEILLLESYPVQVRLLLTGNLPTPCYELRAEVAPPDENHRILVEVYALTDPGEICIQVLEPFEANIPLGAYSEGDFSVWVNGEQIGTFDL